MKTNSQITDRVSKKTTNKLTERLSKWINYHSECGEWLLYQDRNEKFYARQTHTDKEWMI